MNTKLLKFSFDKFHGVLILTQLVKNSHFNTIPSIASVMETSEATVIRLVKTARKAGIPLTSKNGVLGFKSSFALLPLEATKYLDAQLLTKASSKLQAVGHDGTASVLQELAKNMNSDDIPDPDDPGPATSAHKPMVRLALIDAVIRHAPHPDKAAFSAVTGAADRMTTRDLSDMKDNLQLSVTYNPKTGTYAYEDKAHYVAVFVMSTAEKDAIELAAKVLSNGPSAGSEEAVYLSNLAGNIEGLFQQVKSMVCMESFIEEAAAVMALVDKVSSHEFKAAA
jgi:hypothetical protein